VTESPVTVPGCRWSATVVNVALNQSLTRVQADLLLADVAAAERTFLSNIRYAMAGIVLAAAIATISIFMAEHELTVFPGIAALLGGIALSAVPRQSRKTLGEIERAQRLLGEGEATARLTDAHIVVSRALLGPATIARLTEDIVVVSRERLADRDDPLLTAARIRKR
jgi:uncharacterized membrane protein YidH (DUF202 family)